MNKVEVEGNNRISSETIIIFGDVVVGNNYEQSDISLLIKKLYETNFFSNISAELINNKLTIVVKENAIVGKQKSVDDIVKSITKLIDDKILFNKMSLMGRKYIEDNFSNELIVKKWREVFDEK